MQKIKSRGYANAILLAAYTVLTLLLLIFHEPWRDEAQQWLFVKNQSFLSMLSSLHYEGHPALWYLLIWPLTRLGFGYFSVFILHAALVLFCGWLIIYRSPFSPILKFLFLFGYAFGYEYNAVARSYILACVLLFLIAAVFPRRHGKYRIVYGILLILLINTHLFAALTAVTLMIYDFFYLLSQRIPRKGFFHHELVRSFLVICAFFVVGLLLIYLSLRGERDFYADNPVSLLSFLQTNYLMTGDQLYALGMCSQLWTQLTYVFPTLSATSLPGQIILEYNAVAVGISLIALLLYRFKTAFLVVVYCLLLSVLTVAGAPINYFHACLIFALFVFAFWIGKTTPGEFAFVSEMWEKWISRIRIKKVNLVAALASIALITNTGAAAVAVYGDIRYPYSQSKSAAEFLMDNGYDTAGSCIVTPDIAKTTAILAYLKNIRTLSLPGWSDTISYATWDKAYLAYDPDENTIFDYARREYKEKGKLPLVVFCTDGQTVPDDFVCIFDKSGTHTFNEDEEYCIYTLKQ